MQLLAPRDELQHQWGNEFTLERMEADFEGPLDRMYSCRMTRALVVGMLLLSAVVFAKEPTVRDILAMDRVFVGMIGSDPELRPTLLFNGCALTPACEDGCRQQLKACYSGPPSERAKILSSCATFDFDARRKRCEKLTPENWIQQRFRRVADDVEKIVDPAGLEEFKKDRRAAKID